jgi:hypothetical protein
MELQDVLSLTAKLQASAEQLRQMREALEGLDQQIMDLALYIDLQDNPAAHKCLDAVRLIQDAALALTPSQAEQQAKENAEKAALLEWWFSESNEEARDTIRVKRSLSDSPWTLQQWIDAVRTAKEATNV